MPVEYQISGAESVEQILKGLPLKYAKKPMVSTFRKGARLFTKTLRRNTPSASGETRKAIKVKATKCVGLMVGFSGSGAKTYGYFKAYWANYGTYSLRASGHSFKKARKSKTASYSGGVRPRGFVEDSWSQTKNQVQKTIESELKTETMKFLNKHKIS